MSGWIRGLAMKVKIMIILAVFALKIGRAHV